MSLYEIPLTTIDGKPTSLGEHKGEVLLAVNVASNCGHTPQYEALERLYETYADRGFTVLGFPCNQFLFQEPGSAEKIAAFCRTKYHVTFPLFGKLKVNGRDQHPLYRELTKAPDREGKSGRVKWNFEKFLINRDGEVIARFRTPVKPDSPEVVQAIESALG